MFPFSFLFQPSSFSILQIVYGSYPDRSVAVRRLLPRLPDQVLDALPDVRHPLLLLGGRGGVHGEALAPAADQPPVLALLGVIQRLQAHVLQMGTPDEHMVTTSLSFEAEQHQ